MYLKISNEGICHPEAFTVLGVSTARGYEEKIGQFGSGAKMGLNVLLRNNIPPIIVSNDLRIEFTTVDKTMGEKAYKQVVANINGEVKELGFSTEFGELDWTAISMAIREFVSNALDQGGFALEVVDDITEEENHTAVFIPYTQEVKNYHKNIDKYFLAISGEDFVVGDNPNGTLRVYRKGVLVYESDEKSLFRYNISSISVDESRNADSSSVSCSIAFNLHKMSDEQAERYVKALVESEECFEATLNTNYIYRNLIADKLKAAFNRLYPSYHLTTPNLLQYCSKKYKKLKVIPQTKASYLIEVGLPFADTDLGDVGATNGCSPIPVNGDCKRIFNRIWRKLEKHGLTQGKTKPPLKMFVKPMDNGMVLNGYYDPATKSVFIERDSVSANVILEEISHYITEANDCTRDFQDFAFKVAAAVF
jgi:hypothetical protein